VGLLRRKAESMANRRRRDTREEQVQLFYAYALQKLLSTINMF
jgi:hypothetical protein